MKTRGGAGCVGGWRDARPESFHHPVTGEQINLEAVCRLDFLRERLLPRRLETERRGEARTGSEPLIQRPFLLRLVRAHDESACPADVFKRSQSVPALGRSAAGAHQPFGHFAEQYRQFALAPLLQFVV